MSNTMNKRKGFAASHYKGKPAVYDLDTHVVYTGYRSMKAAREHAAQLNKGE